MINEMELQEYQTYVAKNKCIVHVAWKTGFNSILGEQGNPHLFHAIIRDADNQKISTGFFSDMMLYYNQDGTPSSAGFEDFTIINTL